MSWYVAAFTEMIWMINQNLLIHFVDGLFGMKGDGWNMAPSSRFCLLKHNIGPNISMFSNLFAINAMGIDQSIGLCE